MKYFPLVWAALRRKPTRTFVTLLSVTVAFTLFGLMIGFTATMDAIEQQVRADRVYSGARFGEFGGDGMPIAVVSRIAALPGVKSVSVMSYLIGYVQDPKNHAGVFMVDKQAQRVFSDWKITPQQWQKIQQNRIGVVMSRTQATLWQKKVGDTFTLIAPQVEKADGTRTWTFKVLDIGAEIPQAPGGYIFGNYDYFDKSLPLSHQGRVSEVDFIANDPAQAPVLAHRVDHIFANSATPTESQTEKMAYAVGNNFGGLDVNALTHEIALAGLAMILFLTANVITQSVRERLAEFAMLKTIGFSNSILVVLVMLEATTLCLLGAISGVGLAGWLASQLTSIMPPSFGLPLPAISTGVFMSAMLIALAMAFVSATLPTTRLLRMDIASILARKT